MRELESCRGPVERDVQEGDTGTIDVAGTLDDEPQPGLTAEDYSYTVGSGAITPEVDEHLVGSSLGGELELEATHPDHDAERPLTSKVVVKEVQEKVLPEITAEWASPA